MAVVLIAASTVTAFSFSGGSWLATFANALTVSGFFLALVIYLGTSRQFDEMSEKVTPDIEGIPSGELDLKPEEEADQGGGDKYPSPVGEIGGLIRLRLPDRPEVIVYPAEQVPLRVIADIVAEWRDSDQSGTWTVSDIEYAIRRTGQGNFPWLVKFRAGKQFWRVAYGGKGKKEADGGAVTQVPIQQAWK